MTNLAAATASSAPQGLSAWQMEDYLGLAMGQAIMRSYRNFRVVEIKSGGEYVVWSKASGIEIISYSDLLDIFE